MARLVRFSCYLLLFYLASCRSERVAFEFQPSPGSYQPLVVNHYGCHDTISQVVPQAPATPAATSTSADIQQAIKLRLAATQLPAGTTRQTTKVRHPLQNAARALIAKRVLAQSRKSVTSHASVRPTYLGPGDGTVLVFLICALGGAISLLVSLFTLSGVLAVIGVVLLAVALFIFITTV